MATLLISDKKKVSKQKHNRCVTNSNFGSINPAPVGLFMLKYASSRRCLAVPFNFYNFWATLLISDKVARKSEQAKTKYCSRFV